MTPPAVYSAFCGLDSLYYLPVFFFLLSAVAMFVANFVVLLFIRDVLTMCMLVSCACSPAVTFYLPLRHLVTRFLQEKKGKTTINQFTESMSAGAECLKATLL
jgi:hypothetical protein